MGAAEAQMDRIGDRTKRRGQSWSRKGLKSIMQLICWKYEGLFAAVLDRIKQPEYAKLAEFEQIAKEAMHAVASKHLAVKQARVSMLNAGLHQSAGLSNLMHRLITTRWEPTLYLMARSPDCLSWQPGLGTQAGRRRPGFLSLAVGDGFVTSKHHQENPVADTKSQLQH